MVRKNDVVLMQSKDQSNIDFSDIHSPRNQAKLEIMLLDISSFGASLFMFDGELKLKGLRRQANWVHNPEVEKLNQQLHIFGELRFENIRKKAEIVKKFWYEKWRAIDSRYYLFYDEESADESKESYDDDVGFEEKPDDELKEKSDEEVDQTMINTDAGLLDYHKDMEEPEEYSPPNDPEDEFGWKSFCNKKLRLEYENQKELEMYSLSMRNKSLETSMKTIEDKKNTLLNSDDSGTELNSSSSSDEDDTKIRRKMLSEFVVIDKKYDVTLHREWLKFCQSKNFMSEKLKECYNDDKGIQYVLERPIPALKFREQH